MAVRIGGEHYTAARLRAALRRSSNWRQLFRFAVVGASGYVVNLAGFIACVHVAGLDYRLAATIAFVAAVTNNYVANRHWTFDSRHDVIAFQAPRFLAVSMLAFGVSLVLLQIGVAELGAPKVVAQAVAVLVATPVNFVGNKVWTFSYGRRGERPSQSLPGTEPRLRSTSDDWAAR
jgi:dolichol-phosphate mannosyltransferase